MVGIVSYGAYIPMFRMSREVLGQVWGKSAGRGEKAIANADEDSITMAVEAVVDSLTGIDRKTIDGMYFASVSAPYKEKQSASIVRAAADLPEGIDSADFGNSHQVRGQCPECGAECSQGRSGEEGRRGRG